MFDGIYWCDRCDGVFKFTTEKQQKSHPCPICATEATYLSTDVRPVFARERRILQFYGHGPLLTEQVWRASKSPNYFVDGNVVRLPHVEQLKKDLPVFGNFIADSDHYDAVDKRLLQEYKKALELNRLRLNALEDEAFRFIKSSVKRFPRRTIMVSFSGGKDSTVVSDLTRRALGRSDILHIFGDTTLEDENTYQYVREFREQNPLVPFFDARVVTELNYQKHIAHRRRRGEPLPEPTPEEQKHPARRWVVERTFGWLAKRRSIRTRWCKKSENWLAFVQFACAHILCDLTIYG